MSWTTVFQACVIVGWIGILVEVITKNVISHYWKERTAMAKAIGSVNEVRDTLDGSRPKPHTTYEAV